MNTKLYKKLKSTYLVVAGALLILAGTTSCENFLKGQKIREEIEDSIAYANAPEYTITIDYPESCGAVKAPAGGEAKKKVTDTFTISFDTFSDYEFVCWKVINKTNGEEDPYGQYLSIYEPEKAETTCTFRKKPPANAQLCISAVVAERPQIISYSPLTSGAIKDSNIQVLFDRDMDRNSIYFTVEEVEELHESGIPYYDFIPPVENDFPALLYHYGYKTDEDVFYKNISIKNKLTGKNITNCFGAPVFENASTLSIPVASKQAIDDYTQVLVTIEKGFFYTIPASDKKLEKSIEMGASKKWMYQVSDKTDTKPLVIGKSGGKDLSVIKLSSAKGQEITQTPFLSIDKNNGTGIETLNFLKDGKLYIDLQVQESETGSGPTPYFDFFMTRIYDEKYSSTNFKPEYYVNEFRKDYQAVTSEVGVFKDLIDLSDWPFDDGVYQLYYKFYDRSGNVSEYPGVTGTEGAYYYVAIDNSFEMETPVITDKSNYTGARVSLSWKPCIDFEKAVIKYKKADEEEWAQTETVLKGTNSYDCPASGESLALSTEYIFEITCYDYAGHSQTFELNYKTNDWSITVDTEEQTKTVYLRGEQFDKTGITVTYNDLINSDIRVLSADEWTTDFDSDELSMGKNVKISFTDSNGISMSTTIGKTYYIAESDALTQRPIEIPEYYGSGSLDRLKSFLNIFDADAANQFDYTYYKFGDYPQSIATYISDESIPEEDRQITACPVYNGWYLSRDGYFYAKCGEENEKYFKVEPIIWGAIRNENNKLVFMSEKILNASAFYEYDCERLIENETVYPNNYEHSLIRAYLNGLNYLITQSAGHETEQIVDFLGKGLLQTAFTPAAQELILPGVTENLNDKLTLFNNEFLCKDFDDILAAMSEEEFQALGLDKDTLSAGLQQYRKRNTTDYAMANGVWSDPNNDNYGMWWTMIADESGHYQKHNGVRLVSSNGDINSKNVDFNAVGVVPAMIVSDSAISD